METRKKSILIIEDNKIIRGVIKDWLEGHFTVLAAADGEEGINLYEKHREELDLIITDIMMPRICGDGVVEYVREQDKNIPILCITGECEEDTRKKIMSFEKVKIIGKPFTESELNQAIQIMLSA
jgi:CheY-like chemotaxis protein